MIDGPYGNPGVDIDSDKYKILMVVGAGIGINPLSAATKSMIYHVFRGRVVKVNNTKHNNKHNNQYKIF